VPRTDSTARPPQAGLIQFIDRGRWRKQIEPAVAELVDRAGAKLRRLRVQIGPWLIEFVTDVARAAELFSLHWPPARSTTSPDAYCYSLATTVDRELATRFGFAPPDSGSDVRDCTAFVCVEPRRAALIGSSRYMDVNLVCRSLLAQLAARKAPNAAPVGQQPAESLVFIDGACVEYQPNAGPTRSVALLGGSEVERALHAYCLSRSKPASALVAGDAFTVNVTDGQVVAAEQRWWLPTRLCRHLPELAASLALGASDGLDLGAELHRTLVKFHDAADLSRGYENDVFPEDLFTELMTRLSTSDAHSLVDGRSLLTPEQLLDRTLLTDCLGLVFESAADWIVQAVPPGDFIARLGRDGAGPACDSSSDRDVQFVARHLDRLCHGDHLKTALVNTRLPLAQTQFCLRHYFEGRSDSIRILTPADLSADDPLCVAMKIGIGPREHSASPACTITSQSSRQSGLATFLHGTREVTVVAFELAGQRVEAAAFDTRSDGFAQVKSVWPGQVADFFSRHAALDVLKLFTDIRGKSLSVYSV